MVTIARREISARPLDEPAPALHAFQRISADLLGTLNVGLPSQAYLDEPDRFCADDPNTTALG